MFGQGKLPAEIAQRKTMNDFANKRLQNIYQN